MIYSDVIRKSLVCYCCSSKDIFVCSTQNGKHLVHCINCGLYFFYERPTNEELISYYRSQYSSQHQQQLFQTLNESYNIGFFKGETQNHLYYLNMPATKVLDFGSSYGFYLKAMKELGIEVYGIEYRQADSGVQRT